MPAQKHDTINLDDAKELDINDPNHPRHSISVRNQDTLTWECAQDFKILSVHPLPPVNLAKPTNPFRWNDFDARSGTDGRYRVNSGSAVSGADNQRYKVTFIKKDAQGRFIQPPIDPDFIVET